MQQQVDEVTSLQRTKSLEQQKQLEELQGKLRQLTSGSRSSSTTSALCQGDARRDCPDNIAAPFSTRTHLIQDALVNETSVGPSEAHRTFGLASLVHDAMAAKERRRAERKRQLESSLCVHHVP